MSECRSEIYGLFHPITGELRYIGKANDSNERFKGHLRDSNRRNTPVYQWIRSLLEIRLIPEMRILEVCESSWQDAEIRNISAPSRLKIPRIAWGMGHNLNG